MNSVSLISKFIRTVFPAVDSELEMWRKKALCCPDKILSDQAVSSIKFKRFHAQGGCFYSLYPGVDTLSIIKLITAFQTISDYLDNLCDRSGVENEKAFSELHLAITDALDCSNTFHDYYKYYPYKEDGGYLCALVETCKSEIRKLPHYDSFKALALKYGALYSNLQTYKHLSKAKRERILLQWAKRHIKDYDGILPQEFCAATGSTLGIFMIFATSSNPDTYSKCEDKIDDAYFPWICGLHILLDYFIDYNEDMVNGDLNFISYYTDNNETLKRLELFINSSLQKASELQHPIFHTTVIHGLLSMYLSDCKASEPGLKSMTNRLISSGSLKMKTMYYLCRKLRQKHTI